MNKLKQAVGLLNDEAPKNHFLAYINDKEAKLLKQAGGSGEMTPFGVPSFIDYGDVESGLAGGEFGGGSPQETFGGGSDNNTDDSQDDDKALSYVNFDPNTPTSSLNDIGSDSDNSGAIANLINLAKVPYDLVKGNIPTSVLSLLNTNQPKSMPNTTGEDGIGEGDYNKYIPKFDGTLGAILSISFSLFGYVYVLARTSFHYQSQNLIELGQNLGFSKKNHFFP